MKTLKQKTGRKGEEEACFHLMRLGHTILERNWRTSHLEVDIISLDSEGLHFVEVKTRTAPVMADPAVNVNWNKQRHIVQAAQKYIHSQKAMMLQKDIEIFFDILTVVFDKTNTLINYYPKAYIPTYV